MSHDISRASGAPVEVELDGKTYKVGELRLRELGMLQSWIESRVPHPVRALAPHLEGLPSDVQIALLESARKESANWPPRIGTAEGAAVLDTPEGEREILWVLLSRHQPSMTRDEVNILADSLPLAEFRRVADVAFGRDHSPKSTSPA